MHILLAMIKELFPAFSCVYIKLWMNSESLEGTQEARVLSATPQATLTLLSCSPNFPRASMT